MYYPLSQITTNLYTNGGELVYKSSNTSYSGNYWKNSKGQYFTGKTPQDLPTEELILFSTEVQNNLSVNNEIIAYYNQDNSDSVNYINLTKPKSPPLPPTYSPNIPTQQDYQIGEYRRYFCKKTNEILYLETSKDTYDKLINNDPKILYALYQPFNIPWQLTGDKTQVYTTNKNIVELTMKQQQLPQFDLYLKKDFTKYYK